MSSTYIRALEVRRQLRSQLAPANAVKLKSKRERAVEKTSERDNRIAQRKIKAIVQERCAKQQARDVKKTFEFRHRYWQRHAFIFKLEMKRAKLKNIFLTLSFKEKLSVQMCTYECTTTCIESFTHRLITDITFYLKTYTQSS